MKNSAEMLAKLVNFDTPTICNVIELFDFRPRNTGFMNDRIRAMFPEMPPMVGFAATATFRADAPPQEGDVYSSLTEQVRRFEELSGPAVVVFQDLDQPIVAATVGEIMCTTYLTFGAVGLITSGAVRDLDQVHRLGFPLFASSLICAHGYCHVPQVHVPVHVGGISIYPDDLLHADVNGITTIPLQIASEVADAAEEFVMAENVVLDALHTHGANVAMLDQARQESQAQIARLRQRLVRNIR